MSYPALTAFCRREGIGKERPRQSGQYVFEPGQETQHDTSPHRAMIGGREIPVQTASAVLCWSRVLFFQFYPGFTRFECKLFLCDAMAYFGGVTQDVMVDNSHVIVARGTGADMVPAPEMAAFAGRYGFAFKAHELGDANRSARVEAPFRFIERNFLVNRRFRDFADANAQAKAWCDRVKGTYKKHIRAVPAELFATERVHLLPLPVYLPEVYRLCQRVVDIYGYVNLNTNRYSVPAAWISRTVEVREFKERIEITGGHDTIHHQRLIDTVGQRVTLKEHRHPRAGAGAGRSEKERPEERRLRELAPEFAEYARALVERGRKQATLALRQLLRLVQEYPRKPLKDAVADAAAYGLYDLDRLERMVLRRIATDFFPTEDDDE